MKCKFLFKSKDILIKKIKWNPSMTNSKTNFHNHNMNCFFKVLNGKIEETILNKDFPYFTTKIIHKKGDFVFMNKNAIHKCKPLTKSETLHIYTNHYSNNF